MSDENQRPPMANSRKWTMRTFLRDSLMSTEIRVSIYGFAVVSILFVSLTLPKPFSSAMAETAGTTPAADREKSAKDFLNLLSALIGDGDLRNIERFSKVLDVGVTLEPGTAVDNKGNNILAWILVQPQIKNRPIPLPGLQFTFYIQGSVPQVVLGHSRIGRMGFSTPRAFCLTLEDLIRQFWAVSRTDRQ